jgi:hypothetical protein
MLVRCENCKNVIYQGRKNIVRCSKIIDPIYKSHPEVCLISARICENFIKRNNEI